MTTCSKTSRRPYDCNGPLYQYLRQILPAYITPRQALDIGRIADHLGVSREAIYRWIRADKLTGKSKYITKLIELANEPSNVAKLEVTPPTQADFVKFIIA